MRRREVRLRIPEVGFMAGTRAALGAGLGLILADKFRSKGKRKGLGWSLLTFGALTTIPLVAKVVREAR